MRDYSKGFCVLTGTYEGEINRGDIKSITSCAEIMSKNREYLQKIIDLCKNERTRLMLVKTPSNATEEEKTYYNSVEKIAKENGVEFVDYNLAYDEIGLDLDTDFFDATHLNAWGAEKFSKYFVESTDFFTGKSNEDDDWQEDLQKYLNETEKK